MGVHEILRIKYTCYDQASVFLRLVLHAMKWDTQKKRKFHFSFFPRFLFLRLLACEPGVLMFFSRELVLIGIPECQMHYLMFNSVHFTPSKFHHNDYHHSQSKTILPIAATPPRSLSTLFQIYATSPHYHLVIPHPSGCHGLVR